MAADQQGFVDHRTAYRRLLHVELRDKGIEPCRDSLCIYGRSPGQNTNGGCRCLEDFPPEARNYLQRLAQVARVLSTLADPQLIAHLAKEQSDG